MPQFSTSPVPTLRRVFNPSKFIVLARAACLLAALCAPLHPLQAQSVSPALQDELLKRLPQGATPEGSAVDRSREGRTGAAALQSPSEVLPAERELRERQARQQLETLNVPSPTEAAYQQRLNDKTIRQFGYELFRNGLDQGQAINGRIDDSYVVGIGDELVISFQGATARTVTARVDREGRIVLTDLPPIPAAGRSLGAVRRDVEGATRRTLLGTEVFLSLGSVRAVSVLVGGEVENPGQYQLTALSDVVSALARAGGVRKAGSLRAVRIERGGRTLTVDLYGLLGIGRAPNVRLADGDRVIVPAIGPTVAVSGGVARPAIFELSRGGRNSIGDLLDYAGGPLSPAGNVLTLTRVGPKGGLASLDARLGDSARAGDILQVVPRQAPNIGQARVMGYTDFPGPRPIAAAPSIHALFGDVASLKTGTYTPLAVLIRRDPSTTARQLEAINLFRAVNGLDDVRLQSDDELIILGESDIAFVQSVAVRLIVNGPRQPNYQCRSLSHLARVSADSEGERFSAITRSYFPEERKGAPEEKGAERRSAVGRAELPPTGATAAAVLAQSAGQARERSTPLDDAAAIFDANQIDPATCPSTFESNPELLPFIIERAVAVTGSVRRPGPYPVAGRITIGNLAAVAGGRTSGRGDDRIEVTRATDVAYGAPMQNVVMSWTDGADQLVTAEDAVRITGRASAFEAGAVLLSGEFVRPGIYPIRKGERLSELVRRAGGLTEQAFPYGAIFTRKSVRDAQRKGFQRAANELNAGLLAIVARKNVSADAVVAVQSLSQSLQGAEPPGRLVVEADPRVLAARPDLDTILDAGDAVYMPKRPNFVITLGDVLNPAALQFAPRKTVRDYLQESGGLQSTGDEKRTFIVYPNGIAEPYKRTTFGRKQQILPPGTAIVVPKNVDPLYKLDIAKDITQIVSQVASSLATVAILAR